MNTHGRLGEHADIFIEPLLVSSAAGTTSQTQSVRDAQNVCISVAGGTALGASTATQVSIVARQSGDANHATSTTIAGATATLGISTAFQVPNCQSALVTMTTASTLGETLVINGVTLTYSTAPNSTNATALTFGSTLGSTVAGGLEGTMASLTTVINSATAFAGKLTASTVTTAACLITVDSTDNSTDVNVASTGANLNPTINRQMAVIDFAVDELNSTSEYVYFTLSSCDTAVVLAGQVTKTGLRYKPASLKGIYIKTPTT